MNPPFKHRRTRVLILTWLAFASLTVSFLDSNAIAAEPISRVIEPILRQHCMECHGAGEDVEGEVDLVQWCRNEQASDDVDLIDRLIEVIDQREMPPEGSPPLNDSDRQSLIRTLRDELNRSIELRSEYPPTPIRRMNRFQYSNAVEDLLELKVEVFALPERMMRDYGYFHPETGSMPPEVKVGSRPLGKSQLINKRLAGVSPFPQDLRAENGFDNRGDHLSLSPILMESFLKLGRSIVDSPDFHRATCGIWDGFFEPPSETASLHLEAEVRARLQWFLRRAFRRSVSAKQLDRYAGHVMHSIESGESFTGAMKSITAATLASPRFLYLYEVPQSNASDQTEADPTEADLALASRLSFFLWGSIPDETLLSLAEQGMLHESAILSEQVDRMLRDQRLKRFCDSFPSQWLQLERIISAVPDPDLNPEFYFAKFRASMHMMLEPLLLFETVLIENRSILELIDADFSYRSDLLDAWYRDGRRGNKVPPTVIPFHRVEISDRRQGGVITNAAVMTMTSGSVRTKPITRGAWILSVIFRDPPQPPPADVPPLVEVGDANTEQLTLRERFALHRERTDCAGCHNKIDPLGFALENYGPTGIWRDHYTNGKVVDPSGVLFRQHPFTNVVEFKDAILIERDRFAKALAGHLLEFALGREVGVTDSVAIERVVRHAAASEFRMQTLIREVVLSDPFVQRGKMAPGTDAVSNKHENKKTRNAR